MEKGVGTPHLPFVLNPQKKKRGVGMVCVLFGENKWGRGGGGGEGWGGGGGRGGGGAGAGGGGGGVTLLKTQKIIVASVTIIVCSHVSSPLAISNRRSYR